MSRASATTAACARRSGTISPSAYNGRVSAFHPFFPEGPLVRVHFIIGLSEGEAPNPDRASLERAVEAIVRTWIDELGEALERAHEPVKARRLLERYRDAFSDGYRENYSPATAVADIRVIEGLSESRPLGVDFHRRASDQVNCVGLKVWSYVRPIPLSERVPVLENMGFKVVDERTYQIARNPEDETQENGQGTADVWFHDMLLERADGRAVDLDAIKHGLEAAFLVVMRGVAENDGYNALVLAAGMMWRDVALIRTISRFLRQIRVPYSQDYMWATLVKHAPVAADIVRLFHARFDPRGTMSVEERKSARGRGRRGDRDRAAEGGEPRRGPHPEAIRQCGAGGDPHQFLPDRRGRAAEAADRRQIRQPQARRPAGAEAALRDFRLFAAGRGRPSCVSARSRAAASAGPTGRRTSAPRSWAW